jgi:hypothetical protein
MINPPVGSWRAVAKIAQAERDASMALVEPPVPGLQIRLPLNVTTLPREILSGDEIRITEMLPEALVDGLAQGELSATSVTSAFLRRAALAQKLVGSIERHSSI